MDGIGDTGIDAGRCQKRAVDPALQRAGDEEQRCEKCYGGCDLRQRDADVADLETENQGFEPCHRVGKGKAPRHENEWQSHQREQAVQRVGGDLGHVARLRVVKAEPFVHGAAQDALLADLFPDQGADREVQQDHEHDDAAGDDHLSGDKAAQGDIPGERSAQNEKCDGEKWDFEEARGQPTDIEWSGGRWGVFGDGRKGV